MNLKPQEIQTRTKRLNRKKQQTRSGNTRNHNTDKKTKNKERQNIISKTKNINNIKLHKTNQNEFHFPQNQSWRQENRTH